MVPHQDAVADGLVGHPQRVSGVRDGEGAGSLVQRLDPESLSQTPADIEHPEHGLDRGLFGLTAPS